MEVLLTSWISEKMSDDMEKENTLQSYITAYLKDKYIDNLTLNHVMFLEDIQ